MLREGTPVLEVDMPRLTALEGAVLASLARGAPAAHPGELMPLGAAVARVAGELRGDPGYGHLRDMDVQRMLCFLVSKRCVERAVVLRDPYVGLTEVGRAALRARD